MVTTSTPGEQRVLLRNISWQLFESLLVELGEKRSTRLAYYEGKLEFMTPLPEHENSNRLIERLIVTLIEELNLEYNPFGSMTLKRPDIRAGKEPDSCYYIQNETQVRGKTEIDLTEDPPPDLALEIDTTSSSLNQFDIYSVFIWDVNTLIQENLTGNRQQAIVERDTEFVSTKRKDLLCLQFI